ncbi:recombinase family protein [Paenibacillus sp. IHBB 10380]|uniref:recombinase family protein n=1 Tax=Paenibacillus sp. IHBB 10380 TaxID=1566358 RepID=UPI0005CF9DE8|nr:recombinase family protein [Paenibacillus sp. IHBB 10380]AJS59244.1 DNA recombinase [Paenibacillus sp. IHBB 10380]
MINFVEDQCKDVVVYPRVSSDDQQERETIQTQIEFAIKYCDLHNLNIADWYKDDGVSGTIPLDQRPEGLRLLEDAKAGKFKTVLIYNMKRLGRKARVTLDAIYQLEEYGVTIKSMTEPFDTSTPMGRFVITLLAGQAEFDRDTLLETLWHGANRVARLGQWLGGIVPYGYQVIDKFLQINEEPLPGKEELSEAGVIRLMYHLVGNEKWSTIKVADYFNSLNIPPSYVKDGRKIKKGKRKENTAGIWTPGRIRNMVTNPTYKGLHIYGKRSKKDRELINRKVPAIVTEQLWNSSQETLRDNQLEAFRNQKRNYLLRGLIKCGSCGLTYHGTAFTGVGRKPTAYYTCGGKTAYRGPLQGKCKSKNIPAEWIENMVWEECVRFIRNPGEALQEINTGIEIRKSQTSLFLSEKEMIQKSIRDKEPERQSILSLYRQKMITALDVEKQLQEMMSESLSLEQRVRELDDLIEGEKNIEQLFDSAEDLLLSLRSKIENDPSFETQREIVKTLVQEIIVESTTPPGKIRPQASVIVRYSFKRTPHLNIAQAISHTVVLVAILVAITLNIVVRVVKHVLLNIVLKYLALSLIG